MAMQTALANLKSSLQRVRDIADDIDRNASAALADPAILARHETTQCASTVILSGFLESFLREVAEEMISEICSSGVPFQDLPERIRETHFMAGGYFLHKKAKEERRAKPLALTDTTDVARRLASVGAANAAYELLWEAFADTQSNPGPDAIRDFLRKFSVDKPIATLSTAMKMSESTTVLRLQSFIKIRNECAHTRKSTNIPTPSDIRNYCDLVQEISAAIVQVLQDVLTKAPFAPPAATSGSTPVTASLSPTRP